MAVLHRSYCILYISVTRDSKYTDDGGIYEITLKVESSEPFIVIVTDTDAVVSICLVYTVLVYILTDFNYATLTSPYIFQKTVECKLPLL